MNQTAIRGCHPRSLTEPPAPVTCRECGVPMTRGCLLQNNVWVSPTPMHQTIIRQLNAWVLGAGREARKVSAWRCPQCQRLEFITK